MNDTGRGLSYYQDLEPLEQVLERYSQQRVTVTKMLQEDPKLLTETLWKRGSPIATDNECLFKMETNKTDLSSLLSANSSFELSKGKVKCLGCKDVHRMFGGRIGRVARCGNIFLEVESSAKRKLTCTFNTNLPGFEKKGYSTCETTRDDSVSGIESDRFTNRILMSWYLQSVSESVGIDICDRVRVAFSCSGVGYLLRDQSTSISGMFGQGRGKKPISQDDVKQIFKQMACILDVLSGHSFDMGESGLSFDRKSTNYLYKGINVSSRIRLKLSNVGDSSITISGSNTRLHRKLTFASKVARSKASIESDIEISEINGNKVYKLGQGAIRDKSSVYSYLRSIGRPIFQSSINVYLSMIYLMSDDMFHGLAMMIPEIASFWKSLWGESFTWIQDRIFSLGGKDHKSIVPVISRLWLRCDANKMLFSAAKF